MASSLSESQSEAQTNGSPTHSLDNKWVFWFNERPPKGASLAEYESSIRNLGEFSTVEEFWRYMNNLEVSELPIFCTLRLFKAGIKPSWEDPANCNGGKWVFESDKLSTPQIWRKLVLAAIGGTLQCADNLCGTVLSIKPSKDIIQVWNKLVDDPGSFQQISNEFRSVLGLDESCHICYQAHRGSLDFNNQIQEKLKKTATSAFVEKRDLSKTTIGFPNNKLISDSKHIGINGASSDCHATPHHEEVKGQRNHEQSPERVDNHIDEEEPEANGGKESRAKYTEKETKNERALERTLSWADMDSEDEEYDYKNSGESEDNVDDDPWGDDLSQGSVDWGELADEEDDISPEDFQDESKNNRSDSGTFYDSSSHLDTNDREFVLYKDDPKANNLRTNLLRDSSRGHHRKQSDGNSRISNGGTDPNSSPWRIAGKHKKKHRKHRSFSGTIIDTQAALSPRSNQRSSHGGRGSFKVASSNNASYEQGRERGTPQAIRRSTPPIPTPFDRPQQKLSAPNSPGQRHRRSTSDYGHMQDYPNHHQQQQHQQQNHVRLVRSTTEFRQSRAAPKKDVDGRKYPTGKQQNNSSHFSSPAAASPQIQSITHSAPNTPLAGARRSNSFVAKKNQLTPINPWINNNSSTPLFQSPSQQIRSPNAAPLSYASIVSPSASSLPAPVLLSAQPQAQPSAQSSLSPRNGNAAPHSASTEAVLPASLSSPSYSPAVSQLKAETVSDSGSEKDKVEKVIKKEKTERGKDFSRAGNQKVPQSPSTQHINRTENRRRGKEKRQEYLAKTDKKGVEKGQRTEQRRTAPPFTAEDTKDKQNQTAPDMKQKEEKAGLFIRSDEDKGEGNNNNFDEDQHSLQLAKGSTERKDKSDDSGGGEHIHGNRTEAAQQNPGPIEAEAFSEQRSKENEYVMREKEAECGQEEKSVEQQQEQKEEESSNINISTSEATTENNAKEEEEETVVEEEGEEGEVVDEEEEEEEEKQDKQGKGMKLTSRHSSRVKRAKKQIGGSKRAVVNKKKNSNSSKKTSAIVKFLLHHDKAFWITLIVLGTLVVVGTVLLLLHPPKV